MKRGYNFLARNEKEEENEFEQEIDPIQNSETESTNINDFKPKKFDFELLDDENKIYEISIDLKNMNTSEKIEQFIRVEGLSLVSKWIKGYAIESSTDKPLSINKSIILNNLLDFCSKININIELLRKSSLGKNLTRLNKKINDEEIKKKSHDLLVKWKKIIKDLRDLKKTNSYMENKTPEKFTVFKKRLREKIYNINYTPNININLKTAFRNKNKSKQKKKVYFADEEVQIQYFDSDDLVVSLRDKDINYFKYGNYNLTSNKPNFKIINLDEKGMIKNISKTNEIEWKFPSLINLDNNYKINVQSNQKKFIDDLCDRTFYINYRNEIPEPGCTVTKTFLFSDKSIRKIENSKIATVNGNYKIHEVYNYVNELSKSLNDLNYTKLENMIKNLEGLNDIKKQELLKNIKNTLNKNNNFHIDQIDYRTNMPGNFIVFNQLLNYNNINNTIKIIRPNF